MAEWALFSMEAAMEAEQSAQAAGGMWAYFNVLIQSKLAGVSGGCLCEVLGAGILSPFPFPEDCSADFC